MWKEEGRTVGNGEELYNVVLEMDSGRDVTGPLAAEHSSITSIDLFITSWKGSFICQAKLPLYVLHRN